MTNNSGHEVIFPVQGFGLECSGLFIDRQAITRSRAANSKKEVDTKANQRPTTKTSECVFHRKYF